MKRIVLVPVLALAVIAPLVMIAAKPGEKDPKETAALQPPVPVTTLRPVIEPSASDFVLSGRVKAAQEITLTAQIPARLTSLPLREGQTFRAGGTLAAFDSPETRQAVESARATLGSAAAQRDQARRQAARIDSLFRGGLVAERQVELATSDREAAEAGWAGAQASLSRWREDTRLSVPFDGVVVRRHVDSGALLSPGQPILDVRSETVGEIEVAVPESETARLSAGRALVQTGVSGWIPAEVLRIDGMIDYRTRTRVAHLKPLDSAGLEPGAYVRVRLDTGEASGRPAIPVSSLIRRGSLNGVFVVKDDRAWLRWLRTGRETDDRIEVLAGLGPDEEIVAAPANLTDGAPVKAAR